MARQKQLGSRLRSPIPIEEIASSLRSSQRPLSLSHGFFTIQPSPSSIVEMLKQYSSETSKKHFTMIYNMFKIMTMNNLRECTKGKHHGSV